MILRTDEIAKETALRRWVLPEGLHVPIAAVDPGAITTYVGEIVRTIAGRTSPRALLVKVPPERARDSRLPIWDEPGSAVFFRPLQVWVHISYTRYRAAYRHAFPEDEITDKILSHAMNRRTAAAKGYNFVRITPTKRATNSSSAYSEHWAVALHSGPDWDKAARRQGAFIQYADLADLMLMADLHPGGGVMGLVNEGQRLVKPT